MKRICVFCGSSPGSQPEYIEMAKALGKALAQNGIELVYGGGNVGMMGILANAVVEHGGEGERQLLTTTADVATVSCQELPLRNAASYDIYYDYRYHCHYYYHHHHLY